MSKHYSKNILSIYPLIEVIIKYRMLLFERDNLYYGNTQWIFMVAHLHYRSKNIEYERKFLMSDNILHS